MAGGSTTTLSSYCPSYRSRFSFLLFFTFGLTKTAVTTFFFGILTYACVRLYVGVIEEVDGAREAGEMGWRGG